MTKETIAITKIATATKRIPHCSRASLIGSKSKSVLSFSKSLKKKSEPDISTNSLPKKLKESAGIKGVTNSKMDERKRNPDKMMLYFLKMKLVFMAIPFFEEITLHKIFILLKLYHKNLKTAILLRVLR
jgi:hypothetical protein